MLWGGSLPFSVLKDFSEQLRCAAVMKQLEPRPLWCALGGVLFGAILLAYLVAHSRVFGGSAFDPLGLGATIRLHRLSGAVGGVIFGALLPWTRNRIGAAVVGVLAVTPFFILEELSARHADTGDSVSWWFVGVACVLVGRLAGVLTRHVVFSELDSEGMDK